MSVNWTKEDDRWAKQHGWAIFFDDRDGSVFLGALTDPDEWADAEGFTEPISPNFDEDDDKAVAWVREQAEAGEAHCQKALAYLDQENKRR